MDGWHTMFQTAPTNIHRRYHQHHDEQGDWCHHKTCETKQEEKVVDDDDTSIDDGMYQTQSNQ